MAKCYCLNMTLHPSLFPISEDSENQQNIVVMPSLFRETMDMIFESYDLFELHESIESDFIPSHIQSLASSEMSRITMRLTSVMAWLMARKAIASGQISADEELADYQLEGEEYCLNSTPILEELLPSYLIDLLDRTHRLYQRVWRIDQQSRPAQFELQIS